MVQALIKSRIYDSFIFEEGANLALNTASDQFQLALENTKNKLENGPTSHRDFPRNGQLRRGALLKLPSTALLPIRDYQRRLLVSKWKGLLRRLGVSTCIHFVELLSFRRNVMEGIDIEKHFISGKYIIREIVCSICRHQVGWRYVSNFSFDSNSSSCFSTDRSYARRELIQSGPLCDRSC